MFKSIHRLVPFFLAATLCAACNLDQSDSKDSKASETKTPAPATPAPTTTPTPATGPKNPVKASLTGTWLYQNETMPLTQTGSSLKGVTTLATFKQDPANPVEYPVPTLGSVATNGVVKLVEYINYTTQPAKNFQVKKVGWLTNADTLVLDVVSGQKAHTQVWLRKK